MVLVSGVQQSDSVILFQILFPFRLLQYTEYSSLCYTVGLCWLSIPYQIKMTVFLLSCNSFLSVTPVLTCYCKKFETKMSSNLDFAERIKCHDGCKGLGKVCCTKSGLNQVWGRSMACKVADLTTESRNLWARVRGQCVCVYVYPTQCDPMDCSLPGSSVHGTLQARILEWVGGWILQVRDASVSASHGCRTSILCGAAEARRR